MVLSAALGGLNAAEVASRFIDVHGVKFHYLSAGHGSPLVPLHGYAESSDMWKAAIPALAERGTIPSRRDEAGVEGRFPGVAGWEGVYNNPVIWHFRFNGPTPEALVRGRERVYFEHYWNDFAADQRRSLSEAQRQMYTALYARPGRMRAGWAYFISFPKAATDFEAFARVKLPMPVLAIGGDKGNGDALARQTKLVANDVTVIVLKDTGHWLMEERPSETIRALLKLL